MFFVLTNRCNNCCFSFVGYGSRASFLTSIVEFFQSPGHRFYGEYEESEEDKYCPHSIEREF